MTHVTCRPTAKNRDQLWNPTLGNRVWATFTFTFLLAVTLPASMHHCRWPVAIANILVGKSSVELICLINITFAHTLIEVSFNCTAEKPS